MESRVTTLLESRKRIRDEMFESVSGDCEILDLWVFGLERIGRVLSVESFVCWAHCS
jgi:hypothetical protein